MKTLPGQYFALGSIALALSACSGSDTLGTVASGGSTGTDVGGAAGDVGSGGSSSVSSSNSGGATGNAGSPNTGGALGTGGALSTGGSNASANTGGSVSTGGTKATGGATAQGATGGTPATGGTVATGGSKAAGGAQNTGGTPATGGTKATGGMPATGGTKATGGAQATGGSKAATGGSKATGGSTGTSGLGTWTTGYVATMYGNVNSGDCSGYTSFSDTTNFNSQTCPNVTKSTYSSGTANNASYYGATGDLSSLWSGAQCQCQGGGTGNCSAAPSCPSESQTGGNCGICVAVKCDPNGTFSTGSTTNDNRCNTTTYVVVQIIDACPHNHPTNVASSIGWCTSRQANHIDLSCSGLGGISNLGTAIGQAGWLNVDVQQVNCSMGLGTHTL